jgi:hypothetical protein
VEINKNRKYGFRCVVEPRMVVRLSLSLNLSPISSGTRPLFIIYEAITRCGAGANS